MSDDYTARMIQWIMDQAAAGQPQQIPEYDVDPEDWVQDSARRENLYQDQLNDTFDFANSAAAGPGAFAPGAFDSTSTYTPVEQGGMQALRAYAARQNTPEGIIAAGILAGSTAGAEIAKLQAAYEEAKANGTLEGSILEQIPMAPPNDLGEILPDWESLGFRMGDIEEAYITEAQGGTSGALFDPVSGEFVGGSNRQYLLDENGQPVLADVETSMSEAAQRYADQGLSLPTDQFSAWDLMDPNQGQYGGEQLAGTYDAWQQAMEAWRAETAPLGPQDAGKAGLSAAPPGLGKGLPPVTSNNQPGGFHPVDLAAIAGRRPENTMGDQGSPTTPVDLATIAGRSAANTMGEQTGPFTPIDYSGFGANTAAAQAAGQGQSQGGGGAQSADTMALLANLLGIQGNGGTTGPIFSRNLQLGLGGADPVPPPSGSTDMSGGFGSNTMAAQGQGGGSNAMDTMGNILGLPSPNTSTRTGPEPSDTMAMLGNLLGIPQATNTPSTAGAPPGGYVHNGAIFDAMDRIVGYTSSGGGGTPSSTRTGPEPSEQVVRIGKRSKDTRTNAPTVRDRYPKPKARDTAQSRMAQENANAAWQRQRETQRRAGVGTGAYGRAAAAARWLAEQGVTPLSTQLAARRAAGGSYR